MLQNARVIAFAASELLGKTTQIRVKVNMSMHFVQQIITQFTVM